jgi:hypothetical protein
VLPELEGLWPTFELNQRRRNAGIFKATHCSSELFHAGTCMRKLVVTLNTMLRTNTAWQQA